MNINRDYLIINDVKKSNITLDNGSMFFYITDKNTQNIFVNLVINVSNNDLIQKYANIENAEDYTLTMNIIKPNNDCKIIEGKLHDKEKGIFEFNLKKDCCDVVGTYRCELLTKCNINEQEEITTSNSITYIVKKSILNDLDGIVEAPEYPLVIQLFDKLSDIDQYEEDRRANELARQLAEEQRQARFNTLDADMTDSIQAIDNKVIDVENRIVEKEQAVDKLIVDTKADIDDYKVAKDQEIDEYKTAKDTEINNAITVQDNKIDTAISNQNNRIAVVENNDAAQNNRLDIVENRNTQQDNRLTAIEAKNIEQDNRLDEIEAIDVAQNTRLDAIEVKNQQQDDRLLDIEKVNKRQDMNLKCLFAESKNNMIDVTEEGNSIYLQNSTTGYTLIDEIKGNTLVNCNKEPDKELILNGNINTSGDNNITITEGVDGGLVDVALEGNTLVNVSKTKNVTALPLDEELTYLYANTQYTVQFISTAATTADITLGGTQLLAQSIVAGLNKISITTPATLVDNKLVINGAGANISEVVVTDTGRKFSYFEGMKSVGQDDENGHKIEILSQNKNLIDNGINYNNWGKIYDKIDNGFILDKSKQRIAVNAVKNLKHGETYTISCDVELLTPIKRSIQFYFRHADLEYFGKYITTSGKLKWTFVYDERFTEIGIYFQSEENADAKANITNMMLEKGGNVSNSYIDYFLNKKEIPLNEPLRGLPNGVKDRFVKIGGKWYIERNTQKINASDLEWIDMGTDNSFSRGRRYIWAPVDTGASVSVPHVMCNNYLSIAYAEYDYDGECVYVSGDKIYLYINDTLEQFLVKNPEFVTLRKTPTYEPLEIEPTLNTYNEITHLSNNSIIPCNMQIKNTGFNCLLKPSTTYTISSNLGLNTVTTPSTLTEDCLRFMDTDTSDVTSMRDVLVLEGDWTTKADLIPAHFSGMESAFEQELVTDETDEHYGKYKVNAKVVGKNLFDGRDNIQLGYYSSTSGNHISSNLSACCKKFIKVDPGVTYTYSASLPFVINVIRMYDSKYNYIGYPSTITGQLHVPHNCHYIKIAFRHTGPNTDLSSMDLTDSCIQLELGDTATEYEPYKESVIKFYIKDPLRGIGDVKDKVFIQNDKVIVQRNCGIRAYEDGDFGTYITDKVNTVYPLEEPTYEEVEYNDVKLFIESFKNSTLSYNSNVPVTSTVHYSYSVPIVDTVAQTANISDQQDSMIIDLATQVAVMEMMLM